MDINKLKKVAKGAVAAVGTAATIAAAVNQSSSNNIGSKKNSAPKKLSGHNIKVLNDSFDVNEINHYYLSNVKYLYMPEFAKKEVEGAFHKKKIIYETTGNYRPFAGVLETGTFEIETSSSALKNTKDKILESAINTVGKTIGGAIDVLGEKIKTFRCVDKNGKTMLVRVPDIPCTIIKLDGSTMEVKSEDVDDEIEPKIEMIPALVIEADKKYYYFGNGINFEDVNKEFDRIDKEIKECIENEPEEPVQSNDVESRLKNLKSLLDKNLISKEEYDKKTDEILKDL